MNEQEKIVEQPNSVEVSINAKGQYSGKVKVYKPTIKEAYDTVTEYAEKLEKLISSKNGGA